jgi:hypothetical protein
MYVVTCAYRKNTTYVLYKYVHDFSIMKCRHYVCRRVFNANLRFYDLPTYADLFSLYRLSQSFGSFLMDETSALQPQRKSTTSSFVFCPTKAQSYDFDLQRQRWKFLQHHGLPSVFQNLKIFFYFEKRSSLLQRWRCSCKFKIRRIGSKRQMIHTALKKLFFNRNL